MTTKEKLEKTFKGETVEVGLYLAMADRAEEEGYPELALYLRKVAMDEAEHACAAAKLLKKAGSTKENVKKMLAGEQAAEKMKLEAARQAQEEGNIEVAGFFKWTASEERRHAACLKKFLDKL